MSWKEIPDSVASMGSPPGICSGGWVAWYAACLPSSDGCVVRNASSRFLIFVAPSRLAVAERRASQSFLCSGESSRNQADKCQHGHRQQNEYLLPEKLWFLIGIWLRHGRRAFH